MTAQPRLDRDAILDALQDQIDDLTATAAAQQHLIERYEHLLDGLADRVARLESARKR